MILKIRVKKDPIWIFCQKLLANVESINIAWIGSHYYSILTWLNTPSLLTPSSKNNSDSPYDRSPSKKPRLYNNL